MAGEIKYNSFRAERPQHLHLNELKHVRQNILSQLGLALNASNTAVNELLS